MVQKIRGNTQILPEGNNGEIQYNDNGSLIGADDFVYDKATGNVTINNNLTVVNQIAVGLLANNVNVSLNLSDTNKSLVFNNVSTSIRDGYVTLIEGMAHFNSDTKKLEYYNGIEWVELGGNDIFLESVSFNNGTGVLTLTKNDGTEVTTSLDGRYLLIPNLTSTYIPYRDGNNLSDSNIFFDIINDRIGIGTNTPSVKLEVNGGIKATNDISTDGKYIAAGTPGLSLIVNLNLVSQLQFTGGILTGIS